MNMTTNIATYGNGKYGVARYGTAEIDNDTIMGDVIVDRNYFKLFSEIVHTNIFYFKVIDRLFGEIINTVGEDDFLYYHLNTLKSENFSIDDNLNEVIYVNKNEQFYLNDLINRNNYVNKIENVNVIYPAPSDNVLNLNLNSNPVNKIVYDSSPELNDGELRINATAYYPFNGNANDESVNSNDGIINGATLTTDHLGNADNAYHVTRNPNSNIAGDITISSGDSFTCMVFVKPVNDYTAQPSEWYQFLRLTGASGTMMEFGYQGWNNRVDCKTYDIDGGAHAAAESNDTYWLNTEWRCYVCTYDGSDLKLYKNGLWVNTRNITKNLRPVSAFRLNVDNTAQSGDYIISETLFLPVALSDAEVLNLYNVTSTHKLDKPLVTKTDSDGNTITGYELLGRTAITTGLVYISNFGNPLGTVTQDSDFTMFIKFMPQLVHDSARRQGLFGMVYGVALDMTSSYSLQQLYLRGGIRDGTNINVDAFNGGLSRTLTVNNVYTAMITYNGSGDKKIKSYLNGIQNSEFQVTTETFSISRNMGIGEIAILNGDRCGFWGVISKPLIFNRVLTEQERNELFSERSPQLLIDMDTTKTEDVSSSDIILKIPNKYLMDEVISLDTTHRNVSKIINNISVITDLKFNFLSRGLTETSYLDDNLIKKYIMNLIMEIEIVNISDDIIKTPNKVSHENLNLIDLKSFHIEYNLKDQFNVNQFLLRYTDKVFIELIQQIHEHDYITYFLSRNINETLNFFDNKSIDVITSKYESFNSIDSLSKFSGIHLNENILIDFNKNASLIKLLYEELLMNDSHNLLLYINLNEQINIDMFFDSNNVFIRVLYEDFGIIDNLVKFPYGRSPFLPTILNVNKVIPTILDYRDHIFGLASSNNKNIIFTINNKKPKINKYENYDIPKIL
jgi:hypothetical protein